MKARCRRPAAGVGEIIRKVTTGKLFRWWGARMPSSSRRSLSGSPTNWKFSHRELSMISRIFNIDLAFLQIIGIMLKSLVVRVEKTTALFSRLSRRQRERHLRRYRLENNYSLGKFHHFFNNLYHISPITVSERTIAMSGRTHIKLAVDRSNWVTRADWSRRHGKRYIRRR